jgi:hypothetical protein
MAQFLNPINVSVLALPPFAFRKTLPIIIIHVTPMFCVIIFSLFSATCGYLLLETGPKQAFFSLVLHWLPDCGIVAAMERFFIRRGRTD